MGKVNFLNKTIREIAVAKKQVYFYNSAKDCSQLKEPEP